MTQEDLHTLVHRKSNEDREDLIDTVMSQITVPDEQTRSLIRTIIIGSHSRGVKIGMVAYATLVNGEAAGKAVEAMYAKAAGLSMTGEPTDEEINEVTRAGIEAAYGKAAKA